MCVSVSGLLCQKQSTNLLPGMSSDSEVECDTENEDEAGVLEDGEVLPLPCSGSYSFSLTHVHTHTLGVPFVDLCFNFTALAFGGLFSVC